MSENWIVRILEYALEIWNDKLREIWTIVTQSPSSFHHGQIWAIIMRVHGALQAIAYALLVLFFTVGVVKTCGSMTELRKPELAAKLFIRFAIAKAVVTRGVELMMAFLDVVQGSINAILGAVGFGTAATTSLPSEIIAAIDGSSFLESIPLWAVSILGCLLIWVLSFVLILSVYGRFFRIYMYMAISPIPLATFAGEPTQSIGKSFLRGFAAVCLEGAIIILACAIFSAFASSVPDVDQAAAPAAMLWKYIGETSFNMMILVGTVKAADRVVKEMMGL